LNALRRREYTKRPRERKKKLQLNIQERREKSPQVLLVEEPPSSKRGNNRRRKVPKNPHTPLNPPFGRKKAQSKRDAVPSLTHSHYPEVALPRFKPRRNLLPIAKHYR
jgi:hypothetical protein